MKPKKIKSYVLDTIEWHLQLYIAGIDEQSAAATKQFLQENRITARHA